MAGKITALKRQARSRSRVNVYVDGAFAFSLSEIGAAGLRVGQLIRDEEITALRRRDAAEHAHEQALHFLSYRPRSVDELTRYLAGKQVPGDLIAETVEGLVGAGLLDDQQFARFWVENRESFRPRGQAALRYELRRKGVSEETIRSALADVDEAEGAYRAARALAVRLAGADAATFRRRLGAYLSRRGYSYQTVRQTVDRLWQERPARDGAESEQPSEWSRG